MAPEFYISLVTMHGTIMVFFLFTAVLTGGFGNFLIPLQIGARDMAFPFLNALVVLDISGVLHRHLLGVVCDDGRADGRLDFIRAAQRHSRRQRPDKATGVTLVDHRHRAVQRIRFDGRS